MLKFFDADPGWKKFGSEINIPDPQHLLRIRIGFNMYSGPAFYLNANPDPESQTKPDTVPGKTLLSQKVEF
jgi:hypothetical protein